MNESFSCVRGQTAIYGMRWLCILHCHTVVIEELKFEDQTSGLKEVTIGKISVKDFWKGDLLWCKILPKEKWNVYQRTNQSSSLLPFFETHLQKTSPPEPWSIVGVNLTASIMDLFKGTIYWNFDYPHRSESKTWMEPTTKKEPSSSLPTYSYALEQ